MEGVGGCCRNRRPRGRGRVGTGRPLKFLAASAPLALPARQRAWGLFRQGPSFVSNFDPLPHPFWFLTLVGFQPGQVFWGVLPR